VNGTWTATTLSQNVYGYDTAGNRLTNAITMPGGSNRTETYGYDELNRLTSVNYGDTQTQSYVFDPMGNRTQKVDSVSGTENSTSNNANMLLTRGTNNYTNDNDGNTLTGGGRSSVWDSQNLRHEVA
jgi:YD repeat-containing protein